MLWRAVGKRMIDIVGSAAGLLVLSPVLLLVAVGVRWRLGSPVLFRQVRPGLAGREFIMLKFRTMTDERSADGELLPNAQRIPPFGRMLRISSFDELPELWNVLRGDMSLVGPRPLLPKYMPLYTEREHRRHAVRPGITGWAQVNGRNAISWKQKFEYDVWYVEHVSLWLDLKILRLTISKVIRREGIDAAQMVTMPPYDGTN
jgi:lipopolysaccharide/colanic/teichoic acid biosynthesis glycosyltransferase